MPSRREQIKLTAEEALAFIAEETVANVATIGPNSRPHLAPVFYVPRQNGLATWTYGTSQKVRNLERRPEATVLIEAGESYQELRGLSMECDVTILRDLEEVVAIGTGIARKHGDGMGAAEADLDAFVRAQAAKRVGLVFTPTKTVSWDHRKLGGTY
jgi:hypothetical protein